MKRSVGMRTLTKDNRSEPWGKNAYVGKRKIRDSEPPMPDYQLQSL
jgi:hypothetical protein